MGDAQSHGQDAGIDRWHPGGVQSTELSLQCISELKVGDPFRTKTE